MINPKDVVELPKKIIATGEECVNCGCYEHCVQEEVICDIRARIVIGNIDIEPYLKKNGWVKECSARHYHAINHTKTATEAIKENKKYLGELLETLGYIKLSDVETYLDNYNTTPNSGAGRFIKIFKNWLHSRSI